MRDSQTASSGCRWRRATAVQLRTSCRWLPPYALPAIFRRYTNWLDSTKVTFHIQRFPGVNLELDYVGKTLCIQDRYDSSQTTPVTIFVAALSYSDYFYIEGMTRCDISNWINPSLNKDF